MRNSTPTVTQLYRGILSADRSLLAKAITLAESSLDTDRKKSEELLKKLLPHTGKSIRIGITGVPGVGKSTFIETFGGLVSAEGKKIAVLTVDPTSERTKGSILGDKTRMERLSRDPAVYIRPSPSGLALGGVAHHTREVILLCEAAGFDVILVETVGVGQSETYVRNMVDFFLLLMLAGAGDELQGIKKGIMEMADGVVVTKADGENLKAVKQAQADTAQALHMQAASTSGWKTKVLTTSAIENRGMIEVWKMIKDYQKQTVRAGFFDQNRREQLEKWTKESFSDILMRFLSQGAFTKEREKLSKMVMNQKLLPTEAARQLWTRAFAKKK